MKFLKKVRTVSAGFFLLVFAVSCNSQEKGATEYDVRVADQSAPAKEKAMISSSPPAQGGAFQVAERKIIKTANLAMEIAKYSSWNDEVLRQVQNSGGYIVNSSSQKLENNIMSGNVIIRTPQEKFNSVLKTLKSTAKNLENESLGGQDVTEEYYDLQARLANKQKTEVRFQEILKAARNVEDILKVEEELSRIREEIEQMEGRKKFLDNQVVYSTITIEWHEPYPLGVSNGQGFWGKIGDGFKNGIDGFGNVLSGVIAFVIGGLPLFVLIIFVIWIFLKILRKRRARNLQRSEIASEKTSGDEGL